jgi:murein DD-endopeptidase MepM/ murein hydrolase activator NlpD
MRLPFNGTFPITQLFGENPAIYAPFGLKGHNGIDFGLASGNNVLAPFSGTIKEAYFDQNGYGNYIKIEDSIQGSVLGHLLSFNVSIGQTVNEGDKIGISDNTGNSTGAHLHWGYYKFPRDRNNGYNGFINQYDLIKPLLSQDGTMVIEKKVFEELISKLDTQTKLIQSLKDSLALKDTELLKKLQAQKEDLRNKIIALINNYS